MASVENSVRLALKQPFGCIVALLFSAVLITAAAAAIAFSIYALASIGLLKSAIQNETGFYVSSDSIFVNLFTGKCSVRNLKLNNPNIYTSREYFEKSGDPSRPFLIAKNLVVTISPLDLLKGKIVAKNLAAEIENLNCVRLNNSTYNLAEFLSKFSQMFEAAPSTDGENVLKHFEVFVKRVSYRDLSSLIDVVKFDAESNVKISADDVSDFQKLADEAVKVLDSKNLMFISRAIRAVREN